MSKSLGKDKIPLWTVVLELERRQDDQADPLQNRNDSGAGGRDGKNR